MSNTTQPNPKEKMRQLSTEVNNITTADLNKESKEFKLAAFWFYKAKNLEEELRISKQEEQAATEGIGEYANAYNARDRAQLTAQKIADQDRIGETAAATEIDNIIKPSRFGHVVKITWQLVALVIFGILAWQFAANDQFRTSLLSNITGLIILGVIGVVLVYFWKGKK